MKEILDEENLWMSPIDTNYWDVRVQILIWFQTLLLTKPRFQTVNALKSTTLQAYQIISDFFSDALTSL